MTMTKQSLLKKCLLTVRVILTLQHQDIKACTRSTYTPKFNKLVQFNVAFAFENVLQVVLT